MLPFRSNTTLVRTTSESFVAPPLKVTGTDGTGNGKKKSAVSTLVGGKLIDQLPGMLKSPPPGLDQVRAAPWVSISAKKPRIRTNAPIAR